MTEPRPLHPLLALTKARLIEFVRDPGALFWVFGFPILLAVGLGLAFRSQPEQALRLAVGPGLAPELHQALEDAPALAPTRMDVPEGEAAVARAKVDLFVNQGPDGALVYRYDKSRPESRAARLSADDVLQGALGREDVATTTDETELPMGGRYIDFLVPGLIGLNLMGSGMWGIGFAIVDQRKRRLLKRFAATPMNRAHFLLAFMLSRGVFLVFEVAALLLAGWLLFDVTARGSLLSLAAVSLVGAASFSGIALLIGSRTDSTEVGAGWMNFVQLPMWLLSGSFFSYEKFPEVMHPLVRALPLTAVNDALRAVMNDGAGLAACGLELAVLVAWGLVSFGVALKVFRWQ